MYTPPQQPTESVHYIITTRMTCQGNFGPGKKMVRGDQKFQSPGPFFHGILVLMWNLSPTYKVH